MVNFAHEARGPIDDFGRPIPPTVDQLPLPSDLANYDDFDMLQEIQEVVPDAHPEDLYAVARHLKTGAPTQSGIDVAELPPEFTTSDALEELVMPHTRRASSIPIRPGGGAGCVHGAPPPSTPNSAQVEH